MFGFLLQWPTVPTVVMFPILSYMYARLALKEERDIETEFGDEYRHWAAVTPRFFPRLSSPMKDAAAQGSRLSRR
jgi:protein-S-isoprenylcysteine O-methyltransferase Ste14